METKTSEAQESRVHRAPIHLGDDPDATALSLKEMLDFVKNGAAPTAKSRQLYPALIYPYLDHLRVRGEYPLVIFDAPDEAVAQPLTGVVNALIDTLVDDGGDRDKLEHYLFQVELKVKTAFEQGETKTLSALWQDAATSLLDDIEDDKKESVQKLLDQAADALKTDGQLIACRDETPEQLLEHVWKQHWATQNQGFRDDLEELAVKLADVLRADYSKSDEARDPEHLKASMASEDVDFEALSSILKESKTGEAMPETRVERIRTTLATLKDNLFNYDDLPLKKITASSLNDALDQFHNHMKTLVNVFKAVKIAYLELESRYDEEKHDTHFAQFTEANLNPDEWALCPPMFVVLDESELDQAACGTLFQILESGFPIKVLLKTHDPLQRWAQKTLAAADAYVLQTAVSNVNHMTQNMPHGFEFTGPALFSIYVGNADERGDLSTYFDAASALESRALPAFSYCPGGGQVWADQFSVMGTPQAEERWPSGQLTLKKDEDEETLDLRFTYANFAAASTQFKGDILPVAQNSWKDEMVPVSEYITLSRDKAAQKVPYVSMVDADGLLWRTVVSRKIVNATRKVAANWLMLQDLGGIDNSFATRLLDEKKTELEAEKQQEIDDLKAQHEAEMSQTVEEMTRVIVERISAGLLSEATAGPVSFSASAAPAKPKAAATKEEPEAEAAPEPVEAEEEEEEALSFDDPYIDTPLCTSCNECINKNKKMFVYDNNKQAYIADATAGTYRDLVEAAEKCPVNIIHPGKPKNPDEEGLDDLIKRAEPYN